MKKHCPPIVLGVYNIYSVKFLQRVTMITHLSLFLQVYADDVLTKEEQIGLLFRAKQKCESIITAKHKIHGEQHQQRQFCFLLELNANKAVFFFFFLNLIFKLIL